MAETQPRTVGEQFDSLITTGDNDIAGRAPTVSDRRIAGVVRRLPWVDKVKWLGHSGAIEVHPTHDAEIDRYRLDHLTVLAEEVGVGPRTAVWNDTLNAVVIQNRIRNDNRL